MQWSVPKLEALRATTNLAYLTSRRTIQLSVSPSGGHEDLMKAESRAEQGRFSIVGTSKYSYASSMAGGQG